MALVTISLPSTSGRFGLGALLSVIGAVVVGFWLFQEAPAHGGLSPVVITVSLVALASWAARVLIFPGTPARDRVRDVLACVMLVGGSVMVVPTEALLITPAIIGALTATAEPRRPLAFGAILSLVGLAIITAASLLDARPAAFLVGCASGIALGFVVGISRRQARAAELRERELLERELDVEREQARSALLADRATVARDIHDVLAHSLGGLVIQLDAVEALLESGRTEDAALRVTAARVLAADGLGEARRAVATLRDPEADPARKTDGGADTDDPLAAPDAVDRLLAAHESLGGRVVVTGGTADIARLDPRHRRVLAAVLREGLSNARRHAPGEVVSLGVGPVTGGILRVRLSNGLGPADAEAPLTGAPAPTPPPPRRGLAAATACSVCASASTPSRTARS